MSDVDDPRSSARRSAIMRAVGRQDTAPEIAARKILHRLGYRFRLHRKDFPGSPDIVLPKHKVVIFVHGCFWHRHPGCKKASSPKTRPEFWSAKFDANVARDARNELALSTMGWRVVTIWECEVKDETALERRLADLLDSSPAVQGTK